MLALHSLQRTWYFPHDKYDSVHFPLNAGFWDLIVLKSVRPQTQAPQLTAGEMQVSYNECLPICGRQRRGSGPSTLSEPPLFVCEMGMIPLLADLTGFGWIWCNYVRERHGADEAYVHTVPGTGRVVWPRHALRDVTILHGIFIKQ